MFKNTNAGGVTVVGTGEAANWEKQRHYTLKEANILIKKIFQRLLQTHKESRNQRKTTDSKSQIPGEAKK